MRGAHYTQSRSTKLEGNWNKSALLLESRHPFDGLPMATADPHDPAPMQLFHAPAVWYVIAGGFIVLACGAFLWGISAASLSCVPCDCTYSVFSGLERCRWPAILGILFWVFLIAAF